MGGVVLVHGAFHGAWCWDAVVAKLRERSVEVTAPELPLTGFADDVAVARAAIEAADDAVVCGHSYGGSVISAAAAGLPSVRRLVYLCAFMLDSGEDPVEMLVTDSTSSLLGAMQIDEESGTSSVDPSMGPAVFYADSDPAVAAGASARLRPMLLADSWSTVGPPAWRDVPSTYVMCSRDAALPPALQATMAGHATTVVDWDSDHSPWLTRPGAVAELLAAHVAP